MRLIDADTLRWAIRENAPKNVPLWVYQTVNEQPTAYDVDKVVTQLDKVSDCYETNEQGGEHVQLVHLSDAIEIVMAGGKYDK